jgi:hypothetical protein
MPQAPVAPGSAAGIGAYSWQAGDAGVLAYAQQIVTDKVPYAWGGWTKLGMDCSAYVNNAFRAVGISLGGYNGTGHGPATYGLATYGQAVPLTGADRLGSAEPGDDLLFDIPGEGVDSHTAIYAGNDMMYEEPQTGEDAKYTQVPYQLIDKIRRFVNPTTGAPLGPGVTTTTPNTGGVKVAGLDFSDPAPAGSSGTGTAAAGAGVGAGTNAVGFLSSLDNLLNPASSSGGGIVADILHPGEDIADIATLIFVRGAVALLGLTMVGVGLAVMVGGGIVDAVGGPRGAVKVAKAGALLA